MKAPLIRRAPSRRGVPGVYVYDMPVRSGTAYCFSLIPPDRLILAGGLPRPAILGVSDRPETDETDGFRPNLLFVDLLHGVLSQFGHEDPELALAAVARRRGRVPLWDRRSIQPRGLSEDVLGWFDVREGRVVPGSYHPNPDHALITERGVFQLSDGMQRHLMEALLELRVPGPQVPGEH